MDVPISNDNRPSSCKVLSCITNGMIDCARACPQKFESGTQNIGEQLSARVDLVRVVAWLVINGLRSERVQAGMLRSRRPAWQFGMSLA